MIHSPGSATFALTKSWLRRHSRHSAIGVDGPAHGNGTRDQDQLLALHCRCGATHWTYRSILVPPDPTPPRHHAPLAAK